MKAHPFSENRRTHVQQLIDLVESTGPSGITVAKLQSVFALKYGNTKRTVESYLEDAEGTGLIMTNGTRWFGKDVLQKKTLSEYLQEGYIQR